MPIIVPIEENKVGLATATDAKFRAPDTSGSGLEALGAGLAKLGEGGEQLARGIEARRRRAAAAIAAATLDERHQGNIDDAAVKRAYVLYGDRAHEALHGDDGLFRQRGADAHAAFPDLVGKLVDNHDKVVEPLDEVQRAAIAPILGDRLRSDVTQAANHVREQGKAEQQSQAENLQRAAARDAIANLADRDQHDHHMATGVNSLRQQGWIKNLSNNQIDRQVGDYKSAVHAATIGALIESDPDHAADWYARNLDALNGSDQQMVQTALISASAKQRIIDAAAVRGPDGGGAPVGGANDASEFTAADGSFSISGDALNDIAINRADAAAATFGAEPYSGGSAWTEPEGEGAVSVGGIAADGHDDAPSEPISIAAGDGGAPTSIHMDMKPSTALHNWLATVASRDQYVIDAPPNFITRFRRAVPEFVRREKAALALSKSTEPPLEHALLVYQSTHDPHIFTTRVVAAKDEHGIVFRDFVTGARLPFGRLPELSGFRLIIAEHTHPLPWYAPFRRKTAAQGPSNLDVAVSKLHPDIYFLINAAHTNDFLNGSNDESYYFGRGVHPD
jgi:hypothetical protein